MTNSQELYKTNEEFRQYVDRFVHKRPEYTVEDALNHKIIKEEVAEYYDSGANKRSSENYYR